MGGTPRALSTVLDNALLLQQAECGRFDGLSVAIVLVKAYRETSGQGIGAVTACKNDLTKVNISDKRDVSDWYGEVRRSLLWLIPRY
jgi:hypothetical protein